jgi:hypothetical protein
MDVFVDPDDRSQTATADAANGFKSKLTILGGLSLLNVKRLLDSIPHPVSASDMACGAQTNGDDVVAARLEAERAVKGSHVINPGEGDRYFLGEVSQGRLRKIVVSLLNSLENHNEILLVSVKLCLDNVVQFEEVDLFGILNSAWMGRSHAYVSKREFCDRANVGVACRSASFRSDESPRL